MFENVILETIRDRLRSDDPFVTLVGRTQDIEISREGRPNPLCGPRFCGMTSTYQNVNPAQMAGMRLAYDLSFVLTRKIEYRPKTSDPRILYLEGNAFPAIEQRMHALLHQSTPIRAAIRTALRDPVDSVKPDIDGGIEYQGSSPIVYKDADWFFADAEYPTAENARTGQSHPRVSAKLEQGPDRGREYFGVSRSHVYRLRVIVAHRNFRATPTGP